VISLHKYLPCISNGLVITKSLQTGQYILLGFQWWRTKN
jgi:hypothetical protein